MSFYKIQDTTLTSIADAIRQQLNTSSPISVSEMASNILSISGGGGDSGGYTVLTLSMTAKRGSNPSGQLSEVVFYDASMNRMSVYGRAESNTTPANKEQIPPVAIDGNNNTVWCWTWQTPSNLTITINGVFRPAYMSYVTGGDWPVRDPVSFTLTHSYGGTTTQLLSVTNATITESRLTETQKWPCVYS